MRIEIYLASYNEKTILSHLMELAQYDYSEYDDQDVNEYGVYGYKYLDHYWTDTGRYPFIVKADGKLAGFALVRVLDQTAEGKNIYSIAEFFIVRKYRGKGVGKEVIKYIFAKFMGDWTLQTCKNNEIAQHFWRTVTSKYSRTEFNVSEQDDLMVTMNFEVKSEA